MVGKQCVETESWGIQYIIQMNKWGMHMQRCVWTGFGIFWIWTPAASNRIRSEVFFAVARVDFVFTEKMLLVVLDLFMQSQTGLGLFVMFVPDRELIRIENSQNRIGSGLKNRVPIALAHRWEKQWRIQTRHLGGQSNRGCQKCIHLFKYPSFFVTVIGYHTKVVMFCRPKSGHFCWSNCAIFQGITIVWQVLYISFHQFRKRLK